MNTIEEIIIVAGLSGSGKTAFTEKQLLSGFRSRGLDPSKDIEFLDFAQAGDDIALSTKSVCIVYFNTHVESDRHSFEELRDLREEKLVSLLRDKSATAKLYLCYTPDHILTERNKARTEIAAKSADIPSNVNQRHALLRLVEKLDPVTSDIQVVFSGKQKMDLMTTDEFQHGLPSEKLEAIINHTPMLDKAKDTILNSVRIFVSRNTGLRDFLIALRSRWQRIRK